MTQITNAGSIDSASGVDYSKIDWFKKLAQQMASYTNNNAVRLGMQFLEWTRGESAAAFQWRGQYLGHVDEGLGTKVLIAESLFKEFGQNYFGYIAQDTVAMIVNDLITLGLLPFSLSMHVAVGEDGWLCNKTRAEAFLTGWCNACNEIGCVWSCGETPVLKNIVEPGTAVLNGSAIGIASRLFNPANITTGDAIILFGSSGLHANGVTSYRDLVANKELLPHGYQTILPSGKTLGEALLVPTHLYVGLIEHCIASGVEIHYGINITGHGLRKVMRHNRPFTYVLENMPPVHEVFGLMQEKTGMSDRQMYAAYNMGSGFAIILPQREVRKVEAVCERHALLYTTLVAGYVEEGPKRLVIKPNGKNIVYEGNELDIR